VGKLDIDTYPDVAVKDIIAVGEDYL